VTAGADPQDPIGRLTRRAWESPAFEALLFSDPHRAMLAEFGEVPPALADAQFRQVEADRVRVRQGGQGGRIITVRPQYGDEPISAFTRVTLGIPELVIAFQTRRCQHFGRNCTMCVLPLASAHSLVPPEGIARQLDYSFALLDGGFAIERVSFGNEGSPLDTRTLPGGDLKMILERCAGHPGVREVVIETRHEYATAEVLDRVQEQVAPCGLTLKVGLEVADHRIREDILRKGIDLGEFEDTVSRMGRRNIGLSAYVLLKADPGHTDAAGVADAISTCDYLKRLCRRTGTRLELYVNSMYRAAGSPWARRADKAGWTPPRIQDLAAVLWQVAEPGVAVRAGLSEEGLSAPGGHYDALPDYAPEVSALLLEYNRTGDLELLREAATYQDTTPASPHPPSFHEDVRARLGPLLDPVTGLVSAAKPIPASGGSAAFVAAAGYTDPRTGSRSPDYGFGAGWTAGDAKAKAVLEAYERHLALADPGRALLPGEPRGTAVAFTRPDAIATALMEVLERDAAAIWWQARLAAPAVDLDTVDDPHIQRFAAEQRALGRRIWMLDITSAIGVPVFIVFVQDAAGQFPVFGMACHPAKLQAAHKAVLEAAQALCYADSERQKWRLPGQTGNFWEPGEGAVAWASIPDAAAASYLGLAERAGLTLTVHDLPQLCQGLAGVQVIVPGLCGLRGPTRRARVRKEATRRGLPSELLATGQYNLAPFPI
jgi:radical SAM enzyme (TIGR01210 family)